VTEKNTATPKPVEVGPSVDGLTIVTSGLDDGERVITGGQYKLRTNSPISVSTAPPAKDDGES
jgi:multidrug efflux system membrane fusion protein